MKERPIPFSAPMVRAILAGTKVQTRRVVKPQGPMQPECWDNCVVQHGTGHSGVGWYAWDDGCEDDGAHLMRCPYGQPGDRLWVREAWQAELRWDWTAPRDITPGSPVYFEFGDEAVPACAGKKRPGMFMPRWASRITLEVTGVRVERLQDISEADAVAEGITKPAGSQFWHADPRGSSLPGETPQWAFRNLWESINGPGSWDANPWVWVVEFKRVEAS